MQQRKCQANKGVVANSRSNGRSIYGMVQPKKQLAYLAEVLGVTVTYQDFPKKSEGGKEEVFSLVSISTKPPQVSIKDWQLFHKVCGLFFLQVAGFYLP